MSGRFRHAEWVAHLNALGEGLGDDGRSVISLDPDDVMAAARSNTGLDDFGEDDGFVEPYRALCRSLDTEAELTILGRLMARHEVQLLLQNRLQIEDTIKRHPEILEQEIVDPIFVCGLGRSGTTVLHELFSEDPAHRVPRLWEMWHSVPPPESETYETDPRAAIADLEINLPTQVDPDFATMHVSRGNKPNECIFLFGLQFVGDVFLGQYNVPSFEAMASGRDLTPVYAYHKKVLQLLQWRHPGERWVLKSPAHLGRLNFLFSVYPDARVVVTHRDPLRVVGSMSNLTAHLKAMRSSAVAADGDMTVASFGPQMLLDYYAQLRDQMPERDGQIFDLRFSDLNRDPLAAVESIYAHWGLDFSDEARQRVEAYLAKNPQREHGAHQYSFADTGLDVDTERAKFVQYQERFGVESEV